MNMIELEEAVRYLEPEFGEWTFNELVNGRGVELDWRGPVHYEPQIPDILDRMPQPDDFGEVVRGDVKSVYYVWEFLV